MIPLRYHQPVRTVPVINMGLIAANLAIYLWLFGLVAFPNQQHLDQVGRLMLFPNQVRVGMGWQSIFTAMFVHANVVHLGGNMLYLWIFGNNVEDRLGPLKYLGLYLACGVAAAFFQVWMTPVGVLSTVPVLGASGAISGILGAYLVLFPLAKVTTAVLLVFFVRLPALVVIGSWIALQALEAYAVEGSSSHAMGGVAWFAHLGGFACGVALSAAVRVMGKS